MVNALVLFKINDWVTEEIKERIRSKSLANAKQLICVASWLIFYVAHSLRVDLDMLVATASPARTALKISQPTDGGMPPTYDSMH